MTADLPTRPPLIRELGRQPYETVWREMQRFTAERDDTTRDEIWLVEHPPVFTLGQAGRPEHLLAPGDIPVIRTDRGGQVTYHGPGQLVAYLLLNLRRHRLGVRQLVTLIEQSIVDLLRDYGIAAYPRADAPGVYVDARKIAALGLRVRHGCSFHGLSLNVDMDLEPFSRINPCGFADLRVTQMADLTQSTKLSSVGEALTRHLLQRLGYNLDSIIP
ncbi:lipoyl(octanoyl) transferase LipB [Sedimenticola hydrogenitrophicus]|uniref:lipoyl(octanoyl) transferase LipB n=1 Tax=Sedimenticola hydrogenitrophicus TaxID=2967975 RepID=UPI0021A4F94E|nr:lipoyl(octanoyl) transferase LipB [Sedimenticola hydrogenitrophicus]